MDYCIKTPIGKVQVYFKERYDYEKDCIKTQIGKVQEQQIVLLHTV